MLARRGREPRPHPRVPRRARARAASCSGAAAALVPRPCARASEYSDESASVRAAFRGKYLFVYPFVKTRDVVRAARRGALADHAGAHPDRPRVPEGRQPHDATRSASTTRSSSSPSTPTTSARSSTSCSACAPPRPRAYTLRDTPSFTCMRDVARAGAQRARRRAAARRARRPRAERPGRGDRVPARGRPGASARACIDDVGGPLPT